MTFKPQPYYAVCIIVQLAQEGGRTTLNMTVSLVVRWFGLGFGQGGYPDLVDACLCAGEALLLYAM